MKFDTYIGIDPGVNTGIAIWNRKEKRFEFLVSRSILEAMRMLEVYTVFGKAQFIIEDPTKRKWFGNSGREKLQGAGSIKRDFSIWKEWFEDQQVNYRTVAPKNVKTKMNDKHFRELTGYQERTNQHSRDAGMMVYGL